MIPKEFILLMTTIDTTYQKQADASRVKIYYKALEDIDIKLLNNAIKNIILTEEYYPTPATIRKKILKDNTNNISTEKSLMLVEKLVRDYGFYRQLEGMEWLKSKDENTFRIVKAIGYETIRGTEKGVWVNLFNRLHKETQQSKTDFSLLTNNLQSEIDKAKEMLYIE